MYDTLAARYYAFRLIAPLFFFSLHTLPLRELLSATLFHTPRF